VFESFDFKEGGNFFAIKFYDPVSRLSKIINFVKDRSTHLINPDPRLLNPDFNSAVQQNLPFYNKFLNKLLLIMTLRIEDIY
jgi:hypothetical protein